MSKVFLEVWQLDSAVSVTIATEGDIGYRISGPEIIGRSKRLSRSEVDKRDLKEIVTLINSTSSKKDIKFKICHPGTNRYKTFNTFAEAMGLFERFNVPIKVVDGVAESFDSSYNRVHSSYKRNRQWFKAKS
jgi:hypothetical protein